MDESEFKITKLPDDWRLSPEATRKRNLYEALSPADKIREKKAAQKRKYARRRRKKRG